MLWDESFLWGIMAFDALKTAGLPFELVTAEEIRNGRLNEYELLFVPGGWASNKMKSLGDAGIEAIRQFVSAGGSYLGFCGGAGLATLDGIGLLPVRRRPTKDRVPSFSGPIEVNAAANHPLWKGIEAPVFHAWWPSQFIADESVSVLATYGKPLPDAFSSDLNVGDIEARGGWTGLESVYQINLDPGRLLNEPAVIEGAFGTGRVLLSLLHFDTPGDLNGNTVLKNLWLYLGLPGSGPGVGGPGSVSTHRGLGKFQEATDDLERAVSELIDLGNRNFLWYWRNPMLLQWRRGVRGLEFCTLFVMVRKAADLLRKRDKGNLPNVEQELALAGKALSLFAHKARILLVRERLALQNGNITYERCDDPDIQLLREELFSRSKSHGGLFKEVADRLERLLYRLLKETA